LSEEALQIAEKRREVKGKGERKDISSLNIWKSTVHVLLKPDLENFEDYFASV